MTRHVAAAADRLFTSIERGDRGAVADMWSEDIAVWRTDGREPTRCDAKARALRVIDWFMSSTAERRYEILDRQFFDGGFVQQHVLHATGRHGQSIAMRVCIIIKLDNEGHIHRIDEYFDPKELAPLLEQQGNRE